MIYTSFISHNWTPTWQNHLDPMAGYPSFRQPQMTSSQPPPSARWRRRCWRCWAVWSSVSPREKNAGNPMVIYQNLCGEICDLWIKNRSSTSNNAGLCRKYGQDLTSKNIVVHKVDLLFWRVYLFFGKIHNYYMVQSIPPFVKLKEPPKSQPILSVGKPVWFISNIHVVQTPRIIVH